MHGKCILISGPSGSGKTALAYALSKEIDPKTPFCEIVASEIYSGYMNKLDSLRTFVRKSCSIRVKETRKILHGEVLQIEVTSSNFCVLLKSLKGSKVLRLDPLYADHFRKISIGDIVHIDSDNGTVQRLGRSEEHRGSIDIDSDDYISLPIEVESLCETQSYLSLYDIDAANSRSSSLAYSDKLRKEVDIMIHDRINKGEVEFFPGVAFIDEAHLLDDDCLNFLCQVIDSEMSPFIILATNQVGDSQNPHCLNWKILNKCLIIRTIPYGPTEVRDILDVRCKDEGLEFNEETMNTLTGIAISKLSMRFALQLLNPIKACLDENLIQTDVTRIAQLFSN